MTVELRHLRYFLVLAEELNFSRAAERLGIAQPPLSRQIKALESVLGVRLLSRDTRHVSLTDAGRTFHQEARAALERVEHATNVARRAGRGEVGRLALGFAPLTELLFGATLLPTFSRAHPDVRLELHALRNGDQLAALRDGTVQAMLVVLPVPAHADVTIESLYREPLAVAVARASRLARRKSLTVADLGREPFVMIPRPFAPALHDAVVATFRDASVPLRVAHEAAHLPLAFALVAAGMGVAVLPHAAADAYRDGVVFKSLEGGPTLELAVMYRHDHASELLRAFLAVARQATKVGRRQRPPDVTLN